MRKCPRCGTQYPPTVLYCSRDGSPTADDFLHPPDGATQAATARPTAQGPTIIDTDLLMGKTVGNFKLVRRLGAGAMGSVYEGVHPLMGKRVAVKVLGGTLAIEQELVERFFAEARALNQVEHENIVTVIDLGAHPEGFYYCIMELLEGETLTSLLRFGRIQTMRGLFLAAQIADGLSAAHEKGIVHRDLKPANIMVVRHPQTGVEVVKIVDFGIAKLKTKPAEASATATGLIIGTPAYMSPEQAAGRVSEVDGRSDLYSLGLVSYEMFTGRVPFEGRPIGELIAAQIGEVPPPPGTVTPLPRRIDDIVVKLLKKKKEDRFSSASSVARELRLALQALRDGTPDVPMGPSSQPPPGPIPISWTDNNAPVVAAPPKAIPDPPVVPPPPPPVVEPPPPLVRPSIPPTPFRPPVLVAQPVAEPPLELDLQPQEEPPPEPEAEPEEQSTPVAPQPRKSMPPRTAQQARRRKQPRNWVRQGFVIALLLTGGLYALGRSQLVDFSTLVGNATTTLGIAKPEVRDGNTAKISGDGVAAAFELASALTECDPLMKSFRHAAVPLDKGMEHALTAKQAAYNTVDDCLTRRGKALAPKLQWVGAYLDGFAAYRFAADLDSLPKDAQKKARAITDDSGTHNFDPLLYVGRATDKFNDARPDATDVHKGLIDQYLSDLDAITQRAAGDGK